MRTVIELMAERDKSADLAEREESMPHALDDAAFHLGAAHALDWALGLNGFDEIAAPSAVGCPVAIDKQTSEN